MITFVRDFRHFNFAFILPERYFSCSYVWYLRLGLTHDVKERPTNLCSKLCYVH